MHYLGSVVLKNESEKVFTIIDGQQRFITISIIILAALKIIQNFIDKNSERENNIQRKEILMNTFLGSKDAVSLTYASKLKLNAHNDDFYQSRLLQLNIPASSAHLNGSCKLMLSCFNYYYDKMEKSEKFDTPQKLSHFIEEVIGEKILFIQINVEDEISAYTVFETLNARGMELTAADLLKNYLFSLVKSKIDIDNLSRQWDVIVNTVGVNHLPKFLRYYLNSYRPLIRTERLFKEIKEQITKQEEVFPLLEKMQKFADVYTAIAEYENDLWQNNSDKRNLIREISLYGAEQHKSLLLAAFFHLSENEFIKVLRIIKAVVFRYTVISGLNPNDLEKAYNKAAIGISDGKICTASDVYMILREVYVPDESFIHNFSTKTFTINTKTKKLIRYILYSLEKQESGKAYSVFDGEATLEHILPENPNIGWESFFNEEEQSAYVNRLGNLTLLEDKPNRNASNGVLVEKKPIYTASQYNMTNVLCRSDAWTPERVKERQLKMAKIAAGLWKADY